MVRPRARPAATPRPPARPGGARRRCPAAHQSARPARRRRGLRPAVFPQAGPEPLTLSPAGGDHYGVRLDTTENAVARAKQLVESGQYAAALPVLRAHLDDHPEDAQAWHRLAGALIGADDWPAAIEA